MKITREGLLKKINWGRLSGEYPDMDRWGMTIMERTAEALGHEVLDEPELPEKLDIGWSGNSHALFDASSGFAPPVAMLWNDGEGPLGPLLNELALRYNAKGKVLAALERLRLSEGSHWTVSLGEELKMLREERAMLVDTLKAIEAAYEKEKP